MFPFSVTKRFDCGMLQTEIMAEPVQCVPRPVRFSMAPVMILSAGLVTESCVILPYCVISIVALFMCPALVFIAVWLRPEAELFMTASVLGVRTALLCLKLLKYLYSKGKVEFKEAGAGSSWDGRLGYKWKHFLQTAHQGLSHFELLTPAHAVGLSFQLSFHPLPQTVCVCTCSM